MMNMAFQKPVGVANIFKSPIDLLVEAARNNLSHMAEAIRA